MSEGRRAWSFGVLFALVCAGGLVGCSKQYIRVDVTDLSVSGVTQAAEISRTESYQEKLSIIKTLAVRAPDSCRSDSTEATTGKTTGLTSVVQTTCGLRLAELERALVGAGYRVISWDSLNRLERSRNISPYVAAAELGADAVVLVNNLDTTKVETGKKDSLAMKYALASPDGEKRGDVDLNQGTRRHLDDMVVQRFVRTDAHGNIGASATLDATVVFVKSGEALWFYRRTRTRGFENREQASFLFRGRQNTSRGERSTYRPVAARPSETDHSERAVFRSQETGSRSKEQRVDLFKEVEVELVREVTTDFVERFRSGT